MPELPEVETMRRGIAAVAGCRIGDVRRSRCRLKPILVAPALHAFRNRVREQRIEAVARVGKRVVLELENQWRIVFEPRMTGLLLLSDPPTSEHLRLELTLVGPVARLGYWDRRGLGRVELLDAQQFADRFGASRLGPDALRTTAEQLESIFGSSRRPVKVALLDQRCLAGIGNLYASEILHVARVAPARPCREVRRPEWKRIHRAMLDVLQLAIRYEGSTLSDGTYLNALSAPGSYQNHHRVYDRGGLPCLSCRGGQVERVVQAQRSTFFCPRCQP